MRQEFQLLLACCWARNRDCAGYSSINVAAGCIPRTSIIVRRQISMVICDWNARAPGHHEDFCHLIPASPRPLDSETASLLCASSPDSHIRLPDSTPLHPHHETRQRVRHGLVGIRGSVLMQGRLEIDSSAKQSSGGNAEPCDLSDVDA